MLGRFILKEGKIKKIVRKSYAKIATEGSCCCTPTSDCLTEEDVSSNIGYSQEEIDKVPKGSNLGLGCGNPVALASISEGEVVLDLGSGAGFDCFLASDKVGPTGKVIGIDMTPEMIEKARQNAEKANISNVEFRLGEIENLPLDDNSIDIVISNCVINLSPNKNKVFRESYRVLKPGGRIMVSDIVLEKELPKPIKNNLSAYASCISGAELKDKYLDIIKSAGFTNIKIIEETNFPIYFIVSEDMEKTLEDAKSLSKEKIKDIFSLKISALKPVAKDSSMD